MGISPLHRIHTGRAWIDRALSTVVDKINEMLNYEVLTCTFSEANTDTAFMHNLGKIPNRFHVIAIEGAYSYGIITKGTTANTNIRAYFQCTMAGVTAYIKVWRED